MMFEMTMQLSLFESYSSFQFDGTLRETDWSYQFKPGTDDIVINHQESLTKIELLSLINKSAKIERFVYGYNIYYTDIDGINKDLFIRFMNETTKAKESVSDFIEKHFDFFAERESRRKVDNYV